MEEKKGKRKGWFCSYRILGVRFEQAVHVEAFFVAYTFADFTGEFSRCKPEMGGFKDRGYLLQTAFFLRALLRAPNVPFCCRRTLCVSVV